MNLRNVKNPIYIKCPNCEGKIYFAPVRLFQLLEQFKIQTAVLDVREQQIRADQYRSERQKKAEIKALEDKRKYLNWRKDAMKKRISMLESAMELEVFHRFKNEIAKSIGNEKVIEILDRIEEDIIGSEEVNEYLQNRVEYDKETGKWIKKGE